MEARIREIQPMIADSWPRRDHDPKQPSLIQPVTKADSGAESKGVSSNKTGQDSNPNRRDQRNTETLVTEIQSHLDSLSIQLSFTIRDTTGEMVVSVLDRETGDVIRQLPPEELLDLRDRLNELRGVLFDKKA